MAQTIACTVVFMAIGSFLQFQQVEGQVAQNFGTCESLGCANDGTCLEIADFNIFFCICPDGFEGPRCTESLGGSSPCSSSPCANGGTCTDSDDGESFTCECPRTYIGDYCEIGGINQGICGTNPGAQPMPRFFGGSDAAQGTWPWQGYIKFLRGPTFGATLIADQWAVTSLANIEVLATPSSIEYLVFGVTDQLDDWSAGDTTYQIAYVESIYYYPGGNYFLLDGDVAVIKFVQPLNITDYVRPVCLPSPDVNETADYDVCYMTGWGLNENGEFNSNLKEQRTTVIDSADCSARIIEQGAIFLASENTICTTFEEDSVGPCLGDGGNAVVCSRDGIWDMVGIISWGYSCNNSAFPTVNWRASAFYDFINDVVSGTYEAELCVPVEIDECSAVLPYSQTFRGIQYTAAYTMSQILESVSYSEMPYCNQTALQEVLCAVSLGDCQPAEDEAPQVFCRGYCEAVIGYCNLTDAVNPCLDLPYGEYGQKWCTQGFDYSCGEYNLTLTDEQPVLHISSPFAPYVYPELRRCFWLIFAPEGSTIQVKYDYLNIHPDTDLITYGEGDPYDFTSTLARFDGLVAPPIWTSSSNFMWIRFQSEDGPGTSYGFSLYVVLVPPGGRDCLDTDVFCDDTCYDAHVACDFVYDCYDGSDEANCTDFAVGMDGINITSPFYPYPGYPANFTYTWNLYVPDGYEIAIVFGSLNLHSNDSIYIGEGRGGMVENALYRFQGYNSLFRVLPFAQDVWVTLVSEPKYGHSGGNGFALFAYPVNSTVADELECYDVAEFDCGDGVCISPYHVCDGYKQCSNGADEVSCLLDECNDGTPLPPYEFCNQQWFCQDGEDEANCPDLFEGYTFNLYTPGDPEEEGTYLPNLNITWTARAEEGLGFGFKFFFFSTEPDYDTLYIGEDYSNYDTLYYFEGREGQHPYVLPYRDMFARFVSDDSKNTGGFHIEVTVIRVSNLTRCEKGTILHPCQVCDGLWDCPDARDEKYCDDFERGQVFVISTPYFPDSYANNANVTWTFTSEMGTRLVFVPEIFYTEEDYDVLRISNGLDCAVDDYVAELSGVATEVVLSEANTMCMRFTSDYSYVYSGIYSFVYVVTEEDFIVCAEDTSVVPPTRICDREWNCPIYGTDEVDCPLYQFGDIESLLSPGYPDTYPANTTWTWSGSGEEGLAALIEFTSFDLEEDKDFLYIGCYDDPDDDSTIQAVLTGSEIPDPLFINCSSIWLRLVTDEGGSNYGYYGTITVVNGAGECNVRSEVPNYAACTALNVCDVEGYFDCVPLLDEVEKVYSPNFPEPYDNNVMTTNFFIAPPGYQVVLKITDFSLEANFDFLFVGFEPDPTSDSFATALTGDYLDLPYIVQSPGRTLTVKFVSDGNVTDDGFLGFVYTAPAGLECDGEFISPEYICNYQWDCSDGSDEEDCEPAAIGEGGPLTSPGYPDSYPNSEYIVWSFTAEPAGSFLVDIIDLETERGSDFLKIGFGRNPNDTGSVLAILSGNYSSENVVTPGNELWVSFSSDEAFNFAGFYLNITVIEGGDRCDISSALSPEETCGYLQYCEINGTLECMVVSEEPQSVSSPNYPEPYDDFTKIKYYFVAPYGYRVFLNLTDLALENAFDFLYIGSDLDLSSENAVEYLTGNSMELPFTFLSDSRALALKFETDSAIVDRGFYGSVYAISEEDLFICDKDRVIDEEDICNYEWQCLDGADEQDCDGVPAGKSGYLTSPNYPDDYPNDQMITWSFISEPASQFVVYIQDLDLEDGFDFLRIGYGSDPRDNSTVLAHVTGTDLPEEPLVTLRNRLWVQFFSDSSFNTRGFFINFTIIEDIGANCSDGSVVGSYDVCNYILDCPYGADEDDCDLLGEGNSTVIYSPGFPNGYPSDTNITYVIRAEDGLVLLVNFTSFQTEFLFDTVTVGDGDDPYDEDSVLAKVAGLEIPGDVVSNSSQVWIRFVSDSSGNYPGFVANITAVNPEDFETCDNGYIIPPSELCNYIWFCDDGRDETATDFMCSTLGNASRLNFTSPNYPYLVTPNDYQTWTFVATPNLLLNLTVRYFSTAEGNLTIGSGVDPSNESSVLVQLLGKVFNSTTVFSPNNTLWVRFQAGPFGLGFIADLQTYFPGQGDELCGYFPCYNGGNCVTTDDYQTCMCPNTFYTGRYCETHFCDSGDNCRNGGTCIGEGDTYCLCAPGYSGAFCEEPACPPDNGCPDNSVCISMTDEGVQCLCGDSSVTSGSPCPMTGGGPDCSAIVCQNSGVCEENNGVGSCVCPEFFAGEYCEIGTVAVLDACQMSLPYTQTFGNATVNTESVFGIFDDFGCIASAPARRALCRIFHPPVTASDPPTGPCVGACDIAASGSNGLCRLLILAATGSSDLSDVCDPQFTVMVSGQPGLCTGM